MLFFIVCLRLDVNKLLQHLIDKHCTIYVMYRCFCYEEILLLLVKRAHKECVLQRFVMLLVIGHLGGSFDVYYSLYPSDLNTPQI